MIENDKLTLSGKTVLGKNRVREHGQEWVITDHHTRIRPVPSKRSIRSVQTGSERWVSLIDDADFIITPVIEA